MEVRPLPAEEQAAAGKTRDISYRGLYFTADREFAAGTAIQFVLTLPKEITTTDDVRVQCVGRVVRVEKIERGKFDRGAGAGSWVGVAAVIEQYDFLPPVAA